jgi:tetratricopeptide (TPR) repeat protein
MAFPGSARSGPTGGLDGEAPAGRSIEALRAGCARSPNSARPRIDLARAFLKANRAAEAVVPAEQALAIAPGLRAAIETHTAVMAALQAGDPDLVALELTATIEPLNAEAHLALGDAYAALDRPHDAERHFKSALALGRARDANAGLSSLYLAVGMLDASEHHARGVLSDEDRGPTDDTLIAMAHQALAGVFEARGDPASAALHLDQAYARQSLFRQPAAASPFTTLVLLTRTQGNIPFQSLLPPLRFDRTVWYMEHASLDQIAELPAHAVVLNAIGDPDAAMASRVVVDAFVRQSSRPVLNDPVRVRATFRHRLVETLAGLDDVITPRTVRLSAAEIAADGMAAALARVGLEAPVLVRPVGSHGGVGLFLAEDKAALEAMDAPTGRDAYITRFHDTRSADGYFRKYRVIFVDRRAFPYHLAIGRRWMVHHQNADMAGDAARMADEMRFLHEPRAAIGARAMAAVEAIGRRLDLDYAGLDFTLTADGQVLVFEANATMLTHLEPETGPFAAKNPFVQRIIDAFQARLGALAGV